MIGKQFLFEYPNYGTPDSHPDYTARSGQTVTVLEEFPQVEETDTRMFLVEAEDGWKGQVHESELKETS